MEQLSPAEPWQRHSHAPRLLRNVYVEVYFRVTGVEGWARYFRYVKRDGDAVIVRDPNGTVSRHHPNDVRQVDPPGGTPLRMRRYADGAYVDPNYRVSVFFSHEATQHDGTPGAYIPCTRKHDGPPCATRKQAVRWLRRTLGL